MFVGFGGMIEDHVENDFKAGGVQGTDHRLELGNHRLPTDPRCIARLRREEGKRVVAPVIDKTLVYQVPLVEKVAHRQQVDGGDAEPLEMFDHRRCGEAGVSAAQRLGNAGVLLAASLDMCFVENRGRQGYCRRCVVAPVKSFVDDTGRQAVRRVMMLPPGKAADHFASVGIEQQASGVEAVAALRRIGAMHPVSVAESGCRTGKIAVPDMIGCFAHRQRAHPRALEDTQFDRFGVR